jgi:FMN phosphatase YigB (HAD superfamily)
MPSPVRCNTPGAVLGALLIAACGTGSPSQTLDTQTSEAATSGPSTTDTSHAVPTGTATSQASTSGQPDLPPDACEPTTCMAAGKTCGVVPDGCDGELDCGDCSEPETCGGGGVDNVCGQPCVAVRAIFFDLGDTLVESDGGDMFVERPGAEAMIAELKALGMRVGIITNTPPGFTMQDLEDLLVDPTFLDEFEVVLPSSLAASPPKPDPAIFGEAHAMLIDPPPIAEVAFVSENLAEVADQALAPTQGARAAGMLGVHLSAAPPSPLADVTIAPDQLDMLVSLAETQWLACRSSMPEDG